MNKKIFVSSIASILIVGSAVGAYLWKDLSSRPNFSSYTVKKGNIEQTLDIRGTVQPEISADLGFESGGKIIALNYKVGDTVEAGEVLAVSNSDDLKALLAQAVAKRNSAQAVLEENERLVSKEKYKLKALKDDGAGRYDKKAQSAQVKAQKELVDSQGYEVQAADAYVKNIQAQINQTKILAPFSGVVSKQDAEVGETIQANAPVITLLKSSAGSYSEGQDAKIQYKIEGYVSQLDYDRVRVGDKAMFKTDSYKGQIDLESEIIAIDPAETVINNVPGYKITFKAYSGVKLLSGESVSINIELDKKSDVLLIPRKAVFEENKKKFVYVYNGALREKKEIETGIGDENNIEIIYGLKEGDSILILNNNNQH